MRARERAETTGDVKIAQAIQEVSERAQILVREEIELAKVEVTEKVTVLLKGAAVGVAAGIFAVTGLLFLLHGMSWLVWVAPFLGGSDLFLGLFLLAGPL